MPYPMYLVFKNLQVGASVLSQLERARSGFCAQFDGSAKPHTGGVVLFCDVGSPRFATASKKGSSDHIPETGTPQNGRGREVHAWQTLTGEVAETSLH